MRQVTEGIAKFKAALIGSFSAEQVIETIKLSRLFDADYYSLSYPDHVGELGDSLEHYVRIGAGRDYNPNPYFNTRWYRTTYPDVARLGVNPLWHYIRYGSAEYRRPSELFDARRYLDIAGPLGWDGALPLEAFLSSVKSSAEDSPARTYLEALLTTDLDVHFYSHYYNDVAGMSATALLQHYLTIGRVDGRYSNARRAIEALEFLNGSLPTDFDEAAYLAHYDNVATQYPYPGGGIIHYLQFGRAEGLQAFYTEAVSTSPDSHAGTGLTGRGRG